MSLQTTATKMFLQLDEEKRERVLRAAIDEFAYKNYSNASMNVVVKSAGILKGALLKYFNNKAGLFAFVYKMALARVKNYLRQVRDESEGENFFRRLQKVMLAGLDFIHAIPVWRLFITASWRKVALPWSMIASRPMRRTWPQRWFSSTSIFMRAVSAGNWGAKGKRSSAFCFKGQRPRVC